MFVLTYLRRELRHRFRQAALVTAGLAIGVGLAVTTHATATAIGNAQRAVLRTLAGIGTDITVTATPPSDDHGTGGKPSAGDESSTGLTIDAGAVLEQSTVDTIAGLNHVAGATGALILSQISPPPAGSAAIPTSTRIDGVDVTRPSLGPYAAAVVRAGRSLARTDAQAAVAVIDTRYAAAHHLDTGSTLDVAGSKFTVAGIVDQPVGSGAASIYLPLGAAQRLPADRNSPTLSGKVSTVYVAATAAADVGAVEAELAAVLPSATLTSTRDLADAVSGSLAGAMSLADHLGTWLTVGCLLATAAIASLLTLTSVTRRARELGTLKALGWTGRRVVTQILAESVVVGLAGAALGAAVGSAGIGLVNALTPPLTASTGDRPGSAADADNIVVHLNAHIDPGTIATAALLALAAALIAGALAAWRTTRLRPAHALAHID